MKRFVFLFSSLLFLLILTGTMTATAYPNVEDVKLDLVADGLVSPVSMKQADDGTDRNFVVDQVGTVWIMTPTGEILHEPFINLTDRMVDLDTGYDERGLLDIEFHPNYSENGKFYVYYSAPLRSEAPDNYDHTSHIAEYRVNETDPNIANRTSERILMQVDEPQTNHDGGQLLFGKDGYLYISLGDGGGANDVGVGHPPGGNGQNVSTLLGSILRIDVNGTPYGIPSDNPFVGEEGRDEIYAYGFRNPYRMSFDSLGRLFVSNAGQDLFEEVSIVEKGQNYGWNIKEGAHCFDPENPSVPPENCSDSGPYNRTLMDPIIDYMQPENLSSVVVGGHVYEGDELKGYRGFYFFADWNKRLLFATPGENNWTIHEVPLQYRENGSLDSYIMGFGEDENGEIYVLAKENLGPTGLTGKIYRMKSKDIMVNGTEWMFEPTNITVVEDSNVTIMFRNVGSLDHDLYIEGYDVSTDLIPPGTSDTINFVANTSGEFDFWCTVPGHRDEGLEGKLIIQTQEEQLKQEILQDIIEYTMNPSNSLKQLILQKIVQYVNI
ncbi:MAG: PQQ-dependent sugar dehydrogenase [Archaeoglobaceae archaeon]